VKETIPYPYSDMSAPFCRRPLIAYVRKYIQSYNAQVMVKPLINISPLLLPRILAQLSSGMNITVVQRYFLSCFKFQKTSFNDVKCATKSSEERFDLSLLL
jgi:hypothetical protein